MHIANDWKFSITRSSNWIFLISIKKCFGCCSKICSHPINNGSISTIDPMTELFLLPLTKIQLLLEKFGHQFLVAFNHQPSQLKKIGHLIKIINVSVKIGSWHSMFKLTCQIMTNALTLSQPWIVITINKNETWMCNKF